MKLLHAKEGQRRNPGTNEQKLNTSLDKTKLKANVANQKKMMKKKARRVKKKKD